jgi:hypothetical protein
MNIDYTSGNGNDIGLWTESVVLLGDYNADGEVDAADYLVWRKTLNATVSRYFGADGSGDGIVNEADFAVWRASFGNTLSSSGTAVNALVPEPTETLWTICGLAFALMRRRVREC